MPLINTILRVSKFISKLSCFNQTMPILVLYLYCYLFLIKTIKHLLSISFSHGPRRNQLNSVIFLSEIELALQLIHEATWCPHRWEVQSQDVHQTLSISPASESGPAAGCVCILTRKMEWTSSGEMGTFSASMVNSELTSAEAVIW